MEPTTTIIYLISSLYGYFIGADIYNSNKINQMRQEINEIKSIILYNNSLKTDENVFKELNDIKLTLQNQTISLQMEIEKQKEEQRERQNEQKEQIEQNEQKEQKEQTEE